MTGANCAVLDGLLVGRGHIVVDDWIVPHAGEHGGCGIYGKIVFLAQAACAAGVVEVLVGEEYGLDLGHVEAVVHKGFFEAAFTHSGIDEQAAVALSEIVAVAAGA